MSINSLSILIFLFLTISIGLSQNILKNGGFENGFSDWQTSGIADISNDIVHSGTSSFKSNSTISEYSYIYQQVNIEYTSHEVNFWVFPRSDTYNQVFELVANWNGNTADLISAIGFTQDSTIFYTLDNDTALTNQLIYNSWNKITIKADSSLLRQDFYINDKYSCSLTSSYLIPIEWLIIGDVSIYDHFGFFYYDDITIHKNNIGHEYPTYEKTLADIAICNASYPNRNFYFDLAKYSNINSLHLVYGYVNFDWVGGNYPELTKENVSFNVKLANEIIDQIDKATNSTRIKREVDLLPYYNQKDSIQIIFSYKDGDDSFEIVYPRLIINDTVATGLNSRIVLPTNNKILQNYPNPFNPSTTIEYELARTNNVKVEIYNNLGQRINVLLDKKQSAGKHKIKWTGKNQKGVLISTGLYYYKINIGNSNTIKRMVYLR